MTIPTNTNLSRPAAGEEILIETMRRQLALLGELSVRYGVSLRPEPDASRPQLSSPEAVRELVGREMAALAQEQVRVLLLDRQTRLMGQRTIYQGNAYSAPVRPAEVLRPAVVESAPQLIVVHNHPSGDPAPSQQDRDLTEALKEAADLLGIELLDHVVIAGSRFSSLSQMGLLSGRRNGAAR